PSDLPDPGCVRHEAGTDYELALHEGDRARQPHDFAMGFDEFVKPYRADKLHVQFNGGMPLCGGGAQAGPAHGLIRACGGDGVLHEIGEVQMFRLDEEAESGVAISPDWSDQFAKADRLDDFPPRPRRIEYRRLRRCRLVVHAGTLPAGTRAASRRLRSGMSFSALAPSATARPASPSPPTAST